MITREKILSMPVGREMDKLIAIHVMGWQMYQYDKDIEENCYFMLVDDEFEPVAEWEGYSVKQGERKTEEEAWRDNRKFSTDISAAWEVCEIFREKLFSKRKRYMDELQRVISADRGLKNALIVWPDVFWWISPSAICRAALLTTLQDQEAIE